MFPVLGTVGRKVNEIFFWNQLKDFFRFVSIIANCILVTKCAAH